MGRTIGLGRIWSFVLGFRSLVARLAPFKRERESEQRGRIFWQRKVWTANFSATMVTQEVGREKRKVRFFGKGKCELTAIVRIFGMGKCKLIANFSATMMTSLPSISLSLSLCISLSLSHRAYLTHNIGSASALPIIIGSAEALPILCVRYTRWEREKYRERERKTEMTSPLSR